jgi:hypothetical protein
LQDGLEMARRQGVALGQGLGGDGAAAAMQRDVEHRGDGEEALSG